MSTLTLLIALAALLTLGLFARVLTRRNPWPDRVLAFHGLQTAAFALATLLALFIAARGAFTEPVAWALVALLLASALLRPWLDLSATLLLVLQRGLRVGQAVQIGDHRGEITRLGLRTLTLRATDGRSTDVTAWRALTADLQRLSLPDGRVPCHLALAAPTDRSLDTLLEDARDAALQAPWRAGAEPPRVLILPDPQHPQRLLLHIHTFAPDLHAADLLADSITRRLLAHTHRDPAPP